MKRLLLIIFIAAASCAIGVAQEPIEYRMQTDGTLLDSNRGEYTIVEMGNKSAKEIYDEMMMNASRLYKKPNEVLFGVEGKMISLYGGENITFPDRDGTVTSSSIKIRIRFYIKDGKVMMYVPILEDIVRYGSSNITPKELADLYVASDAHPGLDEFEKDLSFTVNYILGIAPNGIYPHKRDW